MIQNKIILNAAAIVVAFTLAFGGLAVSQPQYAQAQTTTTAELQAQINQLLALIAQLQAQLSGGGAVAGVCPYTWTRDLSVGVTGPDVMKLQQFLNSSPDTQLAVAGAGSPGAETQFYGPVTAAAVSKFQAKYRSEILSPLGLTNPTGYFGAGSRAKANALCVAPTTPTTPTTPTNPTTPDNGDEEEEGLRGEGTLGTFEIDDAADDELEEGSHDEAIAELTLEADDGDIRITRMDIALVGVNTPTESDPWDVFEDISLYVNGEEVARKNIDDEDDYLDEDDGTVRFANLSIILEEGEEMEITIAVSVQDHVDGAGSDADWTVSVEQIRYFDADGVATNDDSTDEIGDTASFSIVEEGEDDELRVRVSKDDPKATTLKLEDDRRSKFITVFAFDLDTDDSTNDIEVRQIRVDVDATEDGTTPTSTAHFIHDAQLMIGSKKYDDVTITHGTTGTFVFDIDRNDLVIDAGDSETVKFQLEFKSLPANLEGATIQASTDSDVGYEAEGADDLDTTQLQGAATGKKHTLRTQGSSLEMTSESFVEKTNSNLTADDDQGVYTLKFSVTAFETDVYLNKTATRGTTSTDAGAEYLITSGGSVVATGTSTASLSSTADTVSGDFRVAEGETETFTLKVTFDPATSGFYAVQLNNINFTTTAGGSSFSPQLALPAEDFDTDEYHI